MESRNFNEVRMMWKPNEDSGQQLKKLQTQIETKYNTKFNDYWEFHKWTIENVAEFWEEMWHFSGVICSKPFDKVVDMNVPFEEGPEWFPGAKLNYAENLLKYRDDSVALVLAGEERGIETLSYSQLYQETERYSAAFRKHGLRKGDIVACYMSNRKEAVFAMLGAVSIGAIWTGVLPLLGAQAALNRLGELQPKFMITVDRFKNQGEEVDMLQKVKKIAEGIPSLKKVIIVCTKEYSEKLIHEIRNSCLLKDFLPSVDVPRMQFEQVPFNHPVYINFTSGTTGKPKGVVHGSAVLLTVTRLFLIQVDSNRSSRWFSISPVGWASWSVCTTALFLGSSLLLYEGQPFYLTPTYFWDLLADSKVTHALLPSSVLEEFERRNYVPNSKKDLTSLKLVFSGGSCVKERTFDFVYNEIANNFTFASFYGCTEVIGSCTGFESTVPVYRGEVNVQALGHNLQVLNEKGQAVEGEIGELVLSNISPNILLGYWGDDQRALMKKNFFERFPGKFALGDYALINPVTKGYIICCRSDETLKQRGCRFGSIEIYNVVDMLPEVLDSLCTSLYTSDGDEHAVLFLQMRPDHEFSDDLVKRVRKTIARELTVDHIPDLILEAPEIPYNLNGKKMEILVKKIINKLPHNTESLRNRDSLKYYYNVPEFLK